MVNKGLAGHCGRVKAKGAGFRSIAEPWADTTSLADKMMLTVLAGLAELERGLISERTSENMPLTCRGAGKGIGS